MQNFPQNWFHEIASKDTGPKILATERFLRSKWHTFVSEKTALFHFFADSSRNLIERGTKSQLDLGDLKLTSRVKSGNQNSTVFAETKSLSRSSAGELPTPACESEKWCRDEFREDERNINNKKQNNIEERRNKKKRLEEDGCKCEQSDVGNESGEGDRVEAHL